MCGKDLYGSSVMVLEVGLTSRMISETELVEIQCQWKQCEVVRHDTILCCRWMKGQWNGYVYGSVGATWFRCK